METKQYSEATVLLYDPRRAVRKQTRTVLHTLGFKTFLEFQELEAARSALSSQRVELVILSVDSTDFGVLRLVDDVRRQRCGTDPFVPILLTAWDCKLNTLRPVVESGADDVLLHPFSTAQMSERIETLVRHRKPFVVTEEYFGPDRRTNAALREGPPPIIVPNALKALVEGERDAGPSAMKIEETFSNLRRLKLRNMARSIWYEANCLKESLQDPSLPARYDDELTKLRNSIRAYRKTLIRDDSADLRSLCESLAAVVDKQLGRAPREKSLELLEQSALALRVASKLESDGNDNSDAIEAIGSEVAKASNVEPDLIRAVMG